MSPAPVQNVERFQGRRHREIRHESLPLWQSGNIWQFRNARWHETFLSLGLQPSRASSTNLTVIAEPAAGPPVQKLHVDVIRTQSGIGQIRGTHFEVHADQARMQRHKAATKKSAGRSVTTFYQAQSGSRSLIAWGCRRSTESTGR